MPEAVFSISADINPQINERELQRQAQALASQLNNILSKQVEKVSIAPAAGSFRPFQQELDKTKGVVDRLQSSINTIPRVLSNAGKTGRSAFLKFTDAINLTRREIVGFGEGIKDTIQDTNLFESALNGIKEAGSTLSELPETFGNLSAQIQSGTSFIEQMASQGNVMAQLFVPLQQQGESARTEFVELNRSIDLLTSAVNRFSAAEAGVDSIIGEFDDLNAATRALQQPFFRVQAILNETGTSATDFGKRLRAVFESAAGDPKKLAEGLIIMRDAAQKTAGPMGLLAQLLGRVTVEERAAAKAARLELNASLIELGVGGVQGIQKLTAQFALARKSATDFITFFAPAGRKIAEFGSQGRASIISIGNSITSSLLGRFPQFSTEALSAVEAMSKFVGGASNLDIAASRIQASLNKAASALGNFLGKNLTGPLKSGFGDLTSEFSNLGAQIVAGLGNGMRNAKNLLVTSATSLKNTVVQSLKNALGISSPAKVMFVIGKAIIEGIVAGIKGAMGLLNKALAPIRAIAGQTMQILSSAFQVAGLALTGFVGVAIATGAQFNSLQAIMKSTLPVILGSAEASKELLVQINELNDTSPFARSAFLELTRVLAGFGVQAEKITPLIDSIQQAVAATGGGEGDLLELGQAFARLQSQGRLSLDIIQSFSSRGIDVVSILGQQFGKTQLEMRKMISDGLIPAGQAIDSLTKGLKNKFDGATDAVAKNLPGALDRVKAKTRDFGAELTRAFVSPEGGGAVIDLLNSFATIVNVITKQFLPLLRPALEAVAAAITDISNKAATFAKTLGGFEANKLKEFASGLDGLIGPLAALAAFLPGLLGSLPVIGPFFAQLVGGIPAMTIAITAFLLTLEPVRDGIVKFVEALKPMGESLLPKISDAFKALGQAVGPFIGKLLEALGPVVNAAGEAFGKLLDQIGPISESIKKLLVSLEPTIDFLKEMALIVLDQLGNAFESVGPIISGVVDTITRIVDILTPVINVLKAIFNLDGEEFELNVKTAKAQAALDELAQKEKSLGENFFLKASDTLFGSEQIGGWINGLSDAINEGVADIAGVELPEDVAKAAVENAKKEFQRLNDTAKELTKTADEIRDKFSDAFNAIRKKSEDADKAVGDLTDQLSQRLSSYDQAFNSVLDAAKAAEAARKAIGDANTKASEATRNITKLENERAKALRDVITPVNELAKAERDLTRIRNDLRNSDREEIRIQEELKKLRGEEVSEDRATLDRGIERAKIALNNARRAEIDLINELNRAETTSIDIAGLSLEQVKGRLNTVRATLAAQKQAKSIKSAEQTADEKTGARLDVVDAEKALKDITKERQQFELDTTEKIRDNEERLLELRADKADKLLDEQDQLRVIEDLRKGETSQQAIILDFDEKIKDAKVAAANAQKTVTDAIKASTLAELELKNKSAAVRGDYQAQAGFQQQIHDLKRNGITFDKATEASLSAQSATIVTILGNLDAAQKTAAGLKEELRIASIEALRTTGAQVNLLTEQVGKGIFDPKVLAGIADLPKAVKDVLTGVFNSSAVVDAAGKAVALTDTLLNDILQAMAEEQAAVIGRGGVVNFKDILKAILAKIGLSIPGFAAGYAPGEIRGMNNGVGIARMFEYGKEAVLPLTRQLDLARVVRNPAVLPKILNALPRWSMPEINNNSTPSLTSTRSVPAIKGSGSIHIDRRKEQSQLAGSIGAAVKTAVAEALSESNGLGNDIDINLSPATNHEVLIAREVARQVRKALNGI